MKKILVTWGVLNYIGDPYIDSYLEVPVAIIKLGILTKDLNIADKKAQEYANNIKAMQMRARICWILRCLRYLMILQGKLLRFI